MRVNEYNNLEEFIVEYDEIDRKDIRGFCGIEFTYHGVYYRMCREPISEEKLPTLPNGNKAHYDVMIVHWKNDLWVGEYEYELVGWYENIEDLLQNCHIEGRTFEEVIMDDETEIIGKD